MDDAISDPTAAQNPWLLEIRKSRPRTTKTQKAANDTTLKPRDPPPRLPPGNYTVVMRPRAGLNVQHLTAHEVTNAIAHSCGIPMQEFHRQVTLLIQPTPNVVVASTADPNTALVLSNIKTLQVSSRILEFSSYMKPPPNTCRGVIHGLEPHITSDNLMAYLDANRPQLLHARFMGSTRSVLLTFAGSHVPFYTKVGSILYRSRPYRRTVQLCRQCGEVGHRADVCPQPTTTKCIHCGLQTPPPDHECHPTCQLCNLPHTTAGKDCPKRYKPNTTLRRPTSQVNEQVSWSAVVAGTPSTPPPPPTTHTTPTNAPDNSTAPSSPLMALIKDLQCQLQALNSRLDALENRATPPPTQSAQSAVPSVPLSQIDDAIQARLTAIVLPYIDQKVQQSHQHLSQLIKDTTSSIIQSQSDRIATLEHNLAVDLPPQSKKARPPHDA